MGETWEDTPQHTMLGATAVSSESSAEAAALCMPPEEGCLPDILAVHQRWLQINGKDDQCANLAGARLPAYPWLLHGLVWVHCWRLQHTRPSLSRVQTGLAILLAWWIVPLTRLLFWGNYLSNYDAVHMALLVAVIGSAALLQGLVRMLPGWQSHTAVYARSCSLGTGIYQ